MSWKAPKPWSNSRAKRSIASKRLVKFGLGGKVADGTQGISWIHEDDLNALFLRAITDETFSGPYIASAPNSVSYAEFMRSLRRKVGMPIGLPAPAWAVGFGAHYLFRTDPELVLYGRYVRSARLEAAGFKFRFPAAATFLALHDPVRSVTTRIT